MAAIDPSMLQLQHRGFTYSEMHAFQCDGCGAHLQGFEEFEGSGDEGCSIMRGWMAQEGWTSDPETDRDYCPECAPSPTEGNTK